MKRVSFFITLGVVAVTSLVALWATFFQAYETVTYCTRTQGLEKGPLELTNGVVLPATASDILSLEQITSNRFGRSITREINVQFSIDEEAFSEWARTNGWNVDEVRNGVMITPTITLPNVPSHPVEVHSGLDYHSIERGQGNTSFAVYDRIQKRGYYGFSSRKVTDSG